MPDFDLRADDSQLLVIDVQERFLKVIPEIDAEGACGRACGILVEGAALLDVPTLVTLQSPEKLGPLVEHLDRLAPEAPRLRKNAFSCGDDPNVRDALARSGREHVIICGIEAHICVLATADDLLRRGWQVTVAADGIASRSAEHRDLAVHALRQLGALVLPVESILFRLQREAGVGCFKEISRLVR